MGFGVKKEGLRPAVRLWGLEKEDWILKSGVWALKRFGLTPNYKIFKERSLNGAREFHEAIGNFRSPSRTFRAARDFSEPLGSLRPALPETFGNFRTLSAPLPPRLPLGFFRHRSAISAAPSRAVAARAASYPPRLIKRRAN